MIEVIYKDEKQEAKGNEGIFSVPKNIRQIGLVSETCRIYMEDYVYTFLTREAENQGEKSCLAVLTGETKWASGVTYIFIKGAVTGESEDICAEHIELTEVFWKKIHEELEKYFQGQEIVGWFLGERSLPMEAGDTFCRVHLKHFGGGEKVLMLMDPAEREEAFFRYENNFLIRQSGYYLYYEKNPQMQAYMLDKNPDCGREIQEEVPDEAVKAFRRIIQKKKTEEEKQTEETEERPSVFSYAATACLALAVIAVGMKFYQNYQSMQAINAKTEAASALVAQVETQRDQDLKGDSKKEKTPEADAEDVVSTENTNSEGERKKISSAQGEDQEDAVKPEGDSQNTGSEDEGSDESSDERDKKASGADSDGTGDEVSQEDFGKTEKKVSQDTSETASVRESQEEEPLSEKDKAIYREESDVRKAERRVQEARSESEAASGTAQNSYIIRPGDTLYQISLEKYGSMDAVAEICSLNGIGVDEIIYPGQIIVLP